MNRVEEKNVTYTNYSSDVNKVSNEIREVGCTSVCSTIGDFFSRLGDSLLKSRLQSVYEAKVRKFTNTPTRTVPDNTVGGRRFNLHYAVKATMLETEFEARIRRAEANSKSQKQDNTL